MGAAARGSAETCQCRLLLLAASACVVVLGVISAFLASDLELDGVPVGQIVRVVSASLRTGQPAAPLRELRPAAGAEQPPWVREGPPPEGPPPEGPAAAAAGPAPAAPLPAAAGREGPPPEGPAAAAVGPAPAAPLPAAAGREGPAAAAAGPAPAASLPAAAAPEVAQAPDRGPVGPDDVELVVASYCEDTTWFTSYPGPLTVYSKKHDCTGKLRAAVASSRSSRGRVVELPNLGREGQSYVRHMLLNWDNMTLYTAFAQGAGRHNGIKSLDATLSFLKSQEVPGAPQPLIVPMVGRSSATGWKLFKDKDEPPHEVSPTVSAGLNLHMFQYFPQFDIANHARLLFAMLFGGDPCTAPPPVFAAGAQFIVHRDAIKAKPKKFWEQIVLELERWSNFGYDLERLWLFVLDPECKARDDFKVPKEYFFAVPTWRRMYFQCGAEYIRQTSLSPLQLEGAGEAARPRGSRPRGCGAYVTGVPRDDSMASGPVKVLEPAKGKSKTGDPMGTGGCSWGVAYDKWFGGGTEQKYSAPRTENDPSCLAQCCRDPTCAGVAAYSTQQNACYKHSSVPAKLDHTKSIPLARLNESWESKWSFFVKILPPRRPAAAAGQAAGAPARGGQGRRLAGRLEGPAAERWPPERGASAGWLPAASHKGPPSASVGAQGAGGTFVYYGAVLDAGLA